MQEKIRQPSPEDVVEELVKTKELKIPDVDDVLASIDKALEKTETWTYTFKKRKKRGGCVC